MTMIYFAGLEERAARYQREAAQASAEAMDLRIALGRMGCHPAEDQVLMSRCYDEAAKATAERASNALQFLLIPHIHSDRDIVQRAIDAKKVAQRDFIAREIQKIREARHPETEGVCP